MLVAFGSFFNVRSSIQDFASSHLSILTDAIHKVFLFDYKVYLCSKFWAVLGNKKDEV